MEDLLSGVAKYERELEAQIKEQRQEESGADILANIETQNVTCSIQSYMTEYNPNVTDDLDYDTGPKVEIRVNKSKEESTSPFGDFSCYTKTVLLGGSIRVIHDFPVFEHQALAY